MRHHKYDYDAFISHAVEDKIQSANELCAKLERAGLRIWYSGKELGVGDSIEKTIENGLHRSRYGIVILSPTYLAKNWTIREFYTLLSREIEQRKVILPVLYNITVDDLRNKDLLMADRFAVNADRGIDYVVDRLVSEIRKPKHQKTRIAWLSKIWLVLIASLLVNAALLVKGFTEGHRTHHAGFAPGFVSAEGQISTASVLDQMQSIFNSLNGCECHRSPAATPGNVQLAGYSPEKHVHPVPGHDARKVTMAIVFQVEPASPAQKSTVTDRMRPDDPFLAATDGADRPWSCLNASYDGE